MLYQRLLPLPATEQFAGAVLLRLRSEDDSSAINGANVDLAVTHSASRDDDAVTLAAQTAGHTGALVCVIKGSHKTNRGVVQLPGPWGESSPAWQAAEAGVGACVQQRAPPVRRGRRAQPGSHCAKGHAAGSVCTHPFSSSCLSDATLGVNGEAADTWPC